MYERVWRDGAGAWIDNPFSRMEVRSTKNINVYDMYRLQSVKRFLGLKVAYSFEFGSRKVQKEDKAEVKRNFESAVVE